jgi:hypothetical protein
LPARAGGRNSARISFLKRARNMMEAGVFDGIYWLVHISAVPPGLGLRCAAAPSAEALGYFQWMHCLACLIDASSRNAVGIRDIGTNHVGSDFVPRGILANGNRVPA